MKTKSILAMALVLVTSAVFANDVVDNKLAVISVKKSGIFKVIYESDEYVRATVSVLNEEGNVVFDREIQGKNGFILPMNFSGLISGEYTIVVKHGADSRKRKVNYAETSPIVKPVIQNVHVSKLVDGRYLLSLSSTNAQLVRVNIYDIDDALLHTETRKADGGMAVVYDVKGATGEVRFQITDKTGYTKVVKK